MTVKLTQVYPSVPTSLPDFLVPSSKAHLVAANQALSSGLKLERPTYDDFDDTPVTPLPPPQILTAGLVQRL
jgi:Cytoskeletal-regulatory complex EF hand